MRRRTNSQIPGTGGFSGKSHAARTRSKSHYSLRKGGFVVSILRPTSPQAANEGTPAVGELDLNQAEHLRGARLLCDLLVEAGDAGLTPISWTVSPTGALAGRIVGEDDEVVAEVFLHWLHFLGAQRLADDRSYFGTRILRGLVRAFGCEISLYAYLDAWRDADTEAMVGGEGR